MSLGKSTGLNRTELTYLSGLVERCQRNFQNYLRKVIHT